MSVLVQKDFVRTETKPLSSIIWMVLVLGNEILVLDLVFEVSWSDSVSACRMSPISEIIFATLRP